MPAAIVGIIAGFVDFHFIYVAIHAPLLPSVADGNVVPWSNHGVVHYIPERVAHMEELFFSIAFCAIGLAIIGLVVERGWDAFRRS